MKVEVAVLAALGVEMESVAAVFEEDPSFSPPDLLNQLEKFQLELVAELEDSPPLCPCCADDCWEVLVLFLSSLLPLCMSLLGDGDGGVEVDAILSQYSVRHLSGHEWIHTKCVYCKTKCKSSCGGQARACTCMQHVCVCVYLMHHHHIPP